MSADSLTGWWWAVAPQSPSVCLQYDCSWLGCSTSVPYKCEAVTCDDFVSGPRLLENFPACERDGTLGLAEDSIYYHSFGAQLHGSVKLDGRPDLRDDIVTWDFSSPFSSDGCTPQCGSGPLGWSLSFEGKVIDDPAEPLDYLCGVDVGENYVYVRGTSRYHECTCYTSDVGPPGNNTVSTEVSIEGESIIVVFGLCSDSSGGATHPCADCANNGPGTNRATIGPEGGTLIADNGLELAFDRGAVSHSLSVTVTDHLEDDLPAATKDALATMGLVSLLAFELDIGETKLQSPAHLRMPLTQSFQTGQGLVVRLDPDIPAGAAFVDAAQITSTHVLVASLPFPGIRSSGTYVIAAVPLGSNPFQSVFLQGRVVDEASLGVANALVLPMRAAFPAMTDTTGGYVALSGLSTTDLPTYSTILAQNIDASLLGGITPLLQRPSGDPSIVIIETDEITLRDQTGTTVRITVITIQEVCWECPDELADFFEQAIDFYSNVIVPALRPEQVSLFREEISVPVCKKTTVSSTPIAFPANDWEFRTFPPGQDDPPVINLCGDLVMELAGVAYLRRDLIPLDWPLDDPMIARIAPSPSRIDANNVQLDMQITGLSAGTTEFDVALALQTISVGVFLELQLPFIGFPVFCPEISVELDPEVRAQARFLEQHDIPLEVTADGGSDGSVIFLNAMPSGTTTDCRPRLSVEVIGCGDTELASLDVAALRVDGIRIDSTTSTIRDTLMVWSAHPLSLQPGQPTSATLVVDQRIGDHITAHRFDWPPFKCEPCKNSILEPQYGERCDGSDFGGHTCQTLGFDRGSLACDSECQFDTSGCERTPQTEDLLAGVWEFFIQDPISCSRTCPEPSFAPFCQCDDYHDGTGLGFLFVCPDSDRYTSSAGISLYVEPLVVLDFSLTIVNRGRPGLLDDAVSLVVDTVQYPWGTGTEEDLVLDAIVADATDPGVQDGGLSGGKAYLVGELTATVREISLVNPEGFHYEDTINAQVVVTIVDDIFGFCEGGEFSFGLLP